MPIPKAGKIQHVVIIMEENRSFNDLFYGFPGARTAKFGYDARGNRIELLPVGLEATWDLDHSSYSFFAACDGTGSVPGTDCRMDGFNGGYRRLRPLRLPILPEQESAVRYVPKSETEPYFQIASKYVVGR